jgi:ABC-type Na+ transport system ATPase subunit NatA
MVVVYGKNESGKTTYLDMTVALLASQYDTALMERYGKRELTTFSGSIGIQENGEDLTVTGVDNQSQARLTYLKNVQRRQRPP